MEAGSILDALLALTTDLASIEDLDEALSRVTTVTLDLFEGAEHSSVRILDDEGVLISGARSGAGQDHAPVTFRKGHGVVGWVAEHGEPVRIPDTRDDPRFVTRPNQGFEVRAILAVPMQMAGRVVGVLGLTAPKAGGFAEKDLRLARLLANCTVPVLERARLERLAITDALTRAYNRRYLLDRIEEEMERSRRLETSLSLLVLDLDRFKGVNDQLGHSVGDGVLQGFAERVRASTRRYDILVRYGGDEFVLIMPATDAEQAPRVAARIHDAVRSAPFDADGVEVACTVSIGAVTWNGDEQAQMLVDRADAAMYAAKDGGRNAVHSA